MDSSRLTFNEETHTYYKGGQVIPNVTSIIKPLVDFSGISESVLENARIRGVAVHKAAEYYDNDILALDTVAPVLMPYLDAWVKFKDETGFSVFYNETKVYSEVYGYAGTLDRAGIFPGQDFMSLVDIKARATLTKEVGPQLAGYAQAFEEQEGIKIGRRYTVQLLQNGNYKLTPHTNPHDLNVFLSCLNIYNYKGA